MNPPSSNSLLLGIDVGTTSVKAACFDLNGRAISIHSAEYPTHYVRANWVEQHPDDWWNATCSAIQRVVADLNGQAERIAGIAVSSQAPTLLPVDQHGRPLRPAMIWMDRRAEAEAQELAQTFGAARIHALTGNRPDAFYVAAKLRWFAKHEPDLLRQTHQFLQVNGYINYRLTDVYSLDHAHAAFLQLRNYTTGAWLSEFLYLYNSAVHLFPPVFQGHEIIGTVTPQAAQTTGLAIGTPVVAGTVDGSAAALETGVVHVGTAAEMTGTSTVVLMPVDHALTEPRLIALPHAVPNCHLLVGAMVSSGAALRWFRDQFAAEERQLAAQTHQDAFDILTQHAADVPIGSEGVIFLPYMMGERSPIWHTQARGVFFGLSLATTRATMTRAILEGTAFALRHNLEIAQSIGVQINEIRSVGGGARSALWCQIKADVLNLPVLLPNASIGAPFGDALLAGLGVGLYDDLATLTQQLVTIKQRFEPNLAHHDRYTHAYTLFRRIYDHLRDDFDFAADNA